MNFFSGPVYGNVQRPVVPYNSNPLQQHHLQAAEPPRLQTPQKQPTLNIAGLQNLLSTIQQLQRLAGSNSQLIPELKGQTAPVHSGSPSQPGLAGPSSLLAPGSSGQTTQGLKVLK